MNDYTYMFRNLKWSFAGINNSNIREEVGTIVGVNIRPFRSTVESVKSRDWGLFLYIKLPNGDQYDFAWEMGVTKQNTDNVAVRKLVRMFFMDKLKKRIKRAKDSNSSLVRITIQDYPIIPNLLDTCGVSEWVDLIGKQVVISTIQISNPTDTTMIDMYIRSVDNAAEPNIISQHPLVYQIHSNDENIIHYIESVSKFNHCISNQF